MLQNVTNTLLTQFRYHKRVWAKRRCDQRQTYLEGAWTLAESEGSCDSCLYGFVRGCSKGLECAMSTYDL